jgi:hypothetical protein
LEKNRCLTSKRRKKVCKDNAGLARRASLNAGEKRCRQADYQRFRVRRCLKKEAKAAQYRILFRIFNAGAKECARQNFCTFATALGKTFFQQRCLHESCLQIYARRLGHRDWLGGFCDLYQP